LDLRGRKWRTLHNEELHNLCTSSDIIRVTKSKRIGRARHTACMEKINAYKILVGKSEMKTFRRR